MAADVAAEKQVWIHVAVAALLQPAAFAAAVPLWYWDNSSTGPHILADNVSGIAVQAIARWVLC